MSIYAMMTREAKKEKTPDNALLPMARYGYGLWEIWFDNGPETQARAVKSGYLWPNPDAGSLFEREGSLHASMSGQNLILLSEKDAIALVRKFAEAWPGRRFAVKGRFS